MSRFQVIATLVCITMSAAFAATPTATEIRQAADWTERSFRPGVAAPPFSFVYDRKSSADLLAKWPLQVDQKSLDGNRSQRTMIWRDPNTGLEVRCVAVQYSDSPVAEWTLYLKNGGNQNTPILENVRGLDVHIERRNEPEFLLHEWRGDRAIPESYQPFTEPLLANSSHVVRSVGGRPTSSSFPYFNVQGPDGGMLIGVGWPGQWIAGFERDAARILRLTAGQELTHLSLHPGEEVRSPLIALLFWEGSDTIRAQNLWRTWMLAHNLPRTGGKLPEPISSFCSGGFFPGLKVSEDSEKQFIDVLTRERAGVDYWWMDAGWYPCGKEWVNTGTWEPDPERFPHGIKAVSDYAHSHGMKLILWFEPERATEGSWLAVNHRPWLLSGKLLNLGNPEARTWLTNHVDRFIREQGVDLYRQDFNIDPLDYWRNNDAPDRQGITENLYLQGYLAYWDELRRRHPGMLIDSCSGGGGRNDLETMRRAVPLLRSDYQSFEGNPSFAAGNQGHTYGISSWLPYYGHGVYMNKQSPTYYVRSHMSPAFGIAVDVRLAGIDWNLYRRLQKQWRDVADCMLGDYYPLTPYSLATDKWIAWQFNRPERGDGMIQAFRRDTNTESSMTFLLHGLAPDSQYEFTNLDTGVAELVTGSKLAAGFKIDIGATPGSAIIKYRKVK